VIGRREFVGGVGATLGWSFATCAQSLDQAPRLGVIVGYKQSDDEAQKRVAAFRKGLQILGWAEGKNIHVEYRWTEANAGRLKTYAAELAAINPKVILASGIPVLKAVRAANQSVPIVFVQIADPVGQGIVASMARPGGNITGFSNFEFAMAGKWLEVLKEIAPGVRRAAVLYSPTTGPGSEAPYFLRALDVAASSFSVKVEAAPVNDVAGVEKVLSEYGRDPPGGLLVMSSPFNLLHRKSIIALAARHRVPAVYPFRYHVAEGGLISYGIDIPDEFRRAADYVDRILKGEKPADLPVQQPTKFQLVINLKTAKALGLPVPPVLLVRADEVIE
jgi:putative ABC transport system substrate-binding protein